MEYNYQLVEIWGSTNGCVLRLPDNACIPNDPDNTDWQQYQVWLSEGNQPLPPAGA